MFSKGNSAITRNKNFDYKSIVNLSLLKTVDILDIKNKAIKK